MATRPAEKSESWFRLAYEVSRDVRAPAERVWALLTDSAGFPRWNSTVTSITGTIAAGQALQIKVPVSDRTFTPKVTAFEPGRRMEWSDGMAPLFRGVRTFTLTPTATGVEFRMEEVFAGLFLPMAKGSLPDFRASFDTYAADLARAAEEA